MLLKHCVQYLNLNLLCVAQNSPRVNYVELGQRDKNAPPILPADVAVVYTQLSGNQVSICVFVHIQHVKHIGRGIAWLT